MNYLNRRAVDRAIRDCGGVRATPGKVMAELSFGFWRHLTAASHEKSVWVPYLHHAYPAKTNRADVDKTIGNLNAVRNRIAHHEPIFDRVNAPGQEPARVHADLMRVLGMIAPRRCRAPRADLECHVGACAEAMRRIRPSFVKCETSISRLVGRRWACRRKATRSTNSGQDACPSGDR